MADEPIDVIIPTCKFPDVVQPLVQEVCDTAGCDVRVYATCCPESAAANRNVGLDFATSDFRVMMDDDITGLPQNWVVDLVQVLKDHENCVMVSPALLNPDGSPARFMMGREVDHALRTGLEIVNGPRLLTACIAIRKDNIRFDERFKGSGFEDNAYCSDQNLAYPGCVRIINHDVQVVHVNEMKQQRQNWEFNKALYAQREPRQWP